MTPAPPEQCATKLRHIPKIHCIIMMRLKGRHRGARTPTHPLKFAYAFGVALSTYSHLVCSTLKMLYPHCVMQTCPDLLLAHVGLSAANVIRITRRDPAFRSQTDSPLSLESYVTFISWLLNGAVLQIGRPGWI